MTNFKRAPRATLVRRLALIGVLLFATHAYAGYHWYDAVNITKVYTIWSKTGAGDLGVTFMYLSNGRTCHIMPEDEPLLSTILMVKAQGLRADFVCDDASRKYINGRTSYRLHRIGF